MGIPLKRKNFYIVKKYLERTAHRNINMHAFFGGGHELDKLNDCIQKGGIECMHKWQHELFHFIHDMYSIPSKDCMLFLVIFES